MNSKRSAFVIIGLFVAVCVWVLMIDGEEPEAQNPSEIHGVIEAPRRMQRVRPIHSTPLGSGAKSAILYVRDARTGKPVPAGLVGAPDGSSLGRTDDSGRIEISDVSLIESIATIEVAMLSGLTRLPIKSQSYNQEDQSHVAFVDYLATIEIAIRGAPPFQDAAAARIDLVRFPGVPSDPDLSQRDREKLRFNRSSPSTFIGLYGQLVEKSDAAWPTQNSIIDALTSAEQHEIHAAIEGPCLVSAHVDGYSSESVLVETRLGESVRCQLVMHQYPRVSGRLLGADGVGLEGVFVRIGCECELLDDEFVSERRIGNGFGFSLRGQRQAREKLAFITARCQTPRGGFWSIDVPFTEKVSAYAFVEGMMRRVVVRHVGKYESVQGMVIRLNPDTKKEFFSIRDAHTGDPLRNLPLGMHRCVPPDPLQVQYPPFQTDSQGRIPMAWLEPGLTYQLFPIDSDHPLFVNKSVVLTPGKIVNLEAVPGAAKRDR